MTREKEHDSSQAEEYNELVRELPVRSVEMPGEGKEGVKTLGESIESLEDLTDLQFAMAKLFPSIVDRNAVMIGRIDPSVLISALHLMSVNEIMQQDPKKAINVGDIYMSNYVRLTIGLDGRGRIDTATLIGAAREEKKAERLLGPGSL